jgi:hypothetical protein
MFLLLVLKIQYHLSQLFSRRNVPEVAQLIVDPFVIILFVIVKPHLGKPYRILLQHIDSSSPFVRGSFTEDVAHMRARYNFKLATAHPDLLKNKIVKIARSFLHFHLE